MFNNNFELYENIKETLDLMKELVKNNYENEVDYYIKYLNLLLKHENFFDPKAEAQREYLKNTFYLIDWGYNPINRVIDIFTRKTIIEKLPIELLVQYSNFCNWNVRQHIASYHNTPLEVLKQLSNDHDSYVSHQAIATLTEINT